MRPFGSAKISTPPGIDQTREHVPVLDGVRTVAITLVMIVHLAGMIEPRSELHIRVLRWMSVGWCGVDLFFVLSGYLITRILIETRGTPHYFRRFYARRALRILPLYYGVLSAVLLIGPRLRPGAYVHLQNVLDHQAWIWLHATNLLVAHRGLPAVDGGWLCLSHFWSLAVEEHFYLLWPLAVACFDRTRLLWICGALFVMSLGLRMVITDPAARSSLTPCRVDALAVGCYIALGASRDGGLAPFAPLARKLTALTGAALAVVLIAGADLSPRDHRMATAGVSLFAVFFGAALVTVLTASRASLISRLLGCRLLVSLGRYSYAAYVFHMLIFPVVVPRLFPMGHVAALADSPILSTAAMTACMTALTFVFAALSFHLFEKHFLALKRFF